MSVLSSTYFGEVPDRDRYGMITGDQTIEIHVARSFIEHVHIGLRTTDQDDPNSLTYAEVNLTIEEAEKVLAGLVEAIASASRPRDLWLDEGTI